RREQPPRAVVAVDIAAVERGDAAVAHDVAAGDRAVPVAVEELEDREDGARRGLVRVAPAALPRPPAVVAPARAPAAREVDLLDLVPADVGDRQVAGPAVEREAPRVAQA